MYWQMQGEWNGSIDMEYSYMLHHPERYMYAAWVRVSEQKTSVKLYTRLAMITDEFL